MGALVSVSHEAARYLERLKTIQRRPVPPSRAEVTTGFAQTFRALNVGDSIPATATEAGNARTLAKNLGWKITQRRTSEGLFIWRLS